MEPRTTGTFSAIVERALADNRSFSETAALREALFPPTKIGKALSAAFGRKDHTGLLTANGALGNYLRREPLSAQQLARIALSRREVDDDVGGKDAFGKRLDASRVRGQAMGEHGGADFDYLPVGTVGFGEFAPHDRALSAQHPVL